MSLPIIAVQAPASASGPSLGTVIATLAAVIAAVAALAALKYARTTVFDGRTAHQEAMTAERKARDDFIAAHRAAMHAQAAARIDFDEGRAEDMAERKRALDAQIALERLAEAGRVTEILITMARTAYDETVSPPPTAAGSQRATFIPSVQAQLRSALAVVYALGGPKLETADDLADKAYSLTTQPTEMLQLANASLGELKRLTEQEEKLRRRQRRMCGSLMSPTGRLPKNGST